MTIIQNSTIISKPVREAYAFLADLNNHEQLMPANVQNWSSTKDEARFTIQNMAKISLKLSQRIENKELVCVPSEEAPFDMCLRWRLEELSENTTEATFVIEAELNMMMKMLASGPLQRLADHQVEKLKETLG